MQGQTSSESDELGFEEIEAKASEGLVEARGAIESYAKQHPRIAMGIALGVGFVLGGGITPRVLFGIGAFVARRYARDFARNQLGHMTKGVLGGDSEEDERPRKARAKPSRNATSNE